MQEKGVFIDDFAVGNTACTFVKKNTADGMKFDAKFVTVTKAGKKYVCCNDGYMYQQHPERFDCLIRKPPKGYTTDGTLLFLTEEDADKEADFLLLHRKLKQFFERSSADNLTLAQLQKAAEIFGISV